jgi:hypothetical protein
MLQKMVLLTTLTSWNLYKLDSKYEFVFQKHTELHTENIILININVVVFVVTSW